MTIQPISTRPPEISVTEAIEPAYERVKLMLFKPFDLGKWVAIGFCAWLAGLGEAGGGGGGGGGINTFNNSGHSNIDAEKIRHVFGEVRNYVLGNLDWILPLAIFLVVVLLALGVLVLWLSSRGKFMFLHCVAANVAEVDAPWHQYSAVGNSLFRFRLVLTGLALLLTLPTTIFFIANIFRMEMAGAPDAAGIVACVVTGLGLLLISLAFALILKFTVDFVVPIQFLRGCTCRAAWREFLGLLSAHPGALTVYILFQIVLSMAIGAMIVAAFVATCCIAFCVALIPFVGTVLLLPVLVFKRAYPLYYLAQFGPQYQVMPKSP
jgi:hypothetical protein